MGAFSACYDCGMRAGANSLENLEDTVVVLGGCISAKTLAKLFCVVDMVLKMTTLMRTQTNSIVHLSPCDCPQYARGCYASLCVILYTRDAAHGRRVCKLLQHNHRSSTCTNRYTSAPSEFIPSRY